MNYFNMLFFRSGVFGCLKFLNNFLKELVSHLVLRSSLE